MPHDTRVAVTFTAETRAAQLAFIGASIRDPKMSALLNAGAIAWQNGDRSPVLLALVDLAEDMWADAQQELEACPAVALGRVIS
jgi:hypothetical protein